MNACKWCQSGNVVKHGTRGGVQRFLCNDCGHKFYDKVNFARMRVNDHVIVTALNLYYGGLSTRKVREQLSDIFGETVAQSTVLYWIHKYGSMVRAYVETLMPELSGKYHHDETALKVGGEEKWFWETIDEDTRFLVAHMLSASRTSEDAKKVFTQALEKQRPTAFFTDGSFAYDEAMKKVFYTRYKANKVEWVRRVGIQARETNNIVERLHGTLKDRLRPMRGLKNMESSQELLDGYVVNYNFRRTHSSIGKTPAQAAEIEIKEWKQLIENAQASKTVEEIRQNREIVVEVKSD
ncbi:MAG: IS6 family transposase [Nitrososphaerota archaeon]|nr:IS6 family transposase [Nitrososphaerota archaeon]